MEVIYRNVASIFKAAADDQLIARSPCRNIALPQRDGGRVNPMPTESVVALVNHAPPRSEAALITAAGTGLRQGELFGLTVDRIDFLRKTARIDRQFTTVTGRPPYLGPGKTEKPSSQGGETVSRPVGGE